MTNWHALTIEEVFKRLTTSNDGLSDEEARGRLRKYGPNKLPEPKRATHLAIFLRQFKSSLVYLLVIAGAISFFLREEIDAYIIFATVGITVAFGYFQEQKAEKTLAKLEKMVRHKARVVRAGREKIIEASELVPGDIVILAGGDDIPADTRLISGKNFEAVEASLTGEAMPVAKGYEVLPAGTITAERINMAFMGTNVSRGKATGAVVETGINTEFGKIAKSIAALAESATPLQQKVSRLARMVSVAVVAVVLIVFIGGLLRGVEFHALFTTSVAVAVAAVPESLVVAITIILAVGMVRLLKKKALARKLVSAETLGSTTVICVDKTGTLTEGKMEVDEVYVPQSSKAAAGQVEDSAEARELALEIGMVANEAFVENPHEDVAKWRLHGDQTETALIRAGIEAGLAEKYLALEKAILDEMPFESQNQFMATIIKPSSKLQVPSSKFNVIYYKGAPEKILGAAKLPAEHASNLEKIFEDFSKRGLRVLAVAYRTTEEEKLARIENLLSGLTFVGFIALNDPLREGVRETIKQAHDAGIKVVMITGDNKHTAMTVAKDLGLKIDHEKLIEGQDLIKMDDERLKKEVKNISVYARILPHDKLRIVEAFQANGEAVAMTGDGVNDAPALKKADIGVAMGAGTDVAKDISDIIILDNNFKSIVHAVEQGRVIFDNIKKVITYLLSDSFTEVILIGGSIAAGFPLPILAGQILWVNLVEDGLPSLALAYEPKEKDVMRILPRGKNAPLLDRQMKVIILAIGFLTDLVLLGLFFFLLQKTANLDYVRTMIFTALGADSLFYVFAIRSLRHSIFRVNLFGNLYLLLAVLFGFIMLFAAIYIPFLQDILRTVPLSGGDLLIIFTLGVLKITLIEIAKKLFIIKRT